MTMGGKRALGVLGLAAAVFVLYWLVRRGQVTVAQTPGGQEVSLPSALAPSPPPVYQPGSFSVPPLISSFTAPNPGTAAVFTFSPPANSNTPGHLVGQLPAPGSADAATGPCNCPSSSGAMAFGSESALASALAPLFNVIAQGLGETALVNGPGAAHYQLAAWKSLQAQYGGGYLQGAAA